MVAGVTHKKSVIEYCLLRMRQAEREGARDVTGYVLLWDLLALMLRQNGVTTHFHTRHTSQTRRRACCFVRDIRCLKIDPQFKLS